MPKSRNIKKSPLEGFKNFYLIDANFLVAKFLPNKFFKDERDKERNKRCQDWWKEIDHQLRAGKAFIYIPDLCIAETFKTLSKKYYREEFFPNSAEFNRAKNNLREFLRISSKDLQSPNRKVLVHDISTSRDIVIAVDRFNEVFDKNKLNVQVVDLIILATAKYLMDFFHIDKRLKII